MAKKCFFSSSLLENKTPRPPLGGEDGTHASERIGSVFFVFLFMPNSVWETIFIPS